MRFVAEQHTLAGKGPGLYLFGNYVTPQVHREFTRIMACNDMRTLEYAARNKVNAFFQGGSEDPNGKFVFIEFMKPELKGHEDFMDLINGRVGPLVGKYSLEIPIDVYKYKYKGSLSMCVAIALETGCSYNGGGWNEPFTFQPEDNAEYRKVLELCKHMELTIINSPFN